MLRIHETAIELVREVMPAIREIERCDPDLARQMRRAVMSTPLNIAEGSEQAGKRRGLHYRIALGSARETWSALRAAAGRRVRRSPVGGAEEQVRSPSSARCTAASCEAAEASGGESSTRRLLFRAWRRARQTRMRDEPRPLVMDLAQAAGFEFVGSSGVNANPKGDYRHEGGVWALPPNFADGAKDRATSEAIGERTRTRGGAMRVQRQRP